LRKEKENTGRPRSASFLVPLPSPCRLCSPPKTLAKPLHQVAVPVPSIPFRTNDRTSIGPSLHFLNLTYQFFIQKKSKKVENAEHGHTRSLSAGTLPVAMKSLLAAATSAAPTFLRSSTFPPRSRPFALPFLRGRAGTMLSLARSVSAAAQSRGSAGGAEMEARAAQSGEIHVIVGPMFAGKTTALLRRVQAAASNGRYGTPARPPPYSVCLSFH
jgi:hypothetical protein